MSDGGELIDGVGLPCSRSCVCVDFFNVSREAMYISRRDGKFLKVNASMERLLGYPAGTLISVAVGDTYASEEDRGEFQKAIEREGVVHEYQVPLKRRDGSVILCLVDAIAWSVGDEVRGYHGIIRTREDILDSFQRYFNRLKEERRQVQEERRNLIQDTALLSRYVSDDLLDYVRRTGKNPLESGRRRVTVMFFDIRGSTAISEKLDPGAFASLLSDIFTDIMDLVYGCKGSVNKLIGDGLMASFGCPLSSGDDAVNALESAMQIMEYLKTFNDVRPPFLTEPLAIGLGLATGEAFAGIIGSVRRQEYTVLGNCVNRASRLEALTKLSPEKILYDEETYNDTKHCIPGKAIMRGKLRGMSETSIIYAPRPGS